MRARAIMVLGSSSHAGKSLVAAGLCRLFRRAGVKVAPFKAQNMSNNAAVTVDGGEIGRAQAVQAMACGLEPRADMNPVLLKPMSGGRMQIVVQGRPDRVSEARAYRAIAPTLWPRVVESYARLAEEHDVIVLEGAGSCAELNIAWDFTNLRIAAHADADCILVGDIDRGGIFAQLIGTLSLLDAGDRARFIGTIINKFRGDRALVAGATAIIEERTGIPVLGVLPFLEDHGIAEEDSLGIPRGTVGTEDGADRDDVIGVAVIRLPSISNFTDLAPLEADPRVRVRYVEVARRDPIGNPDVVVLPGAKDTLGDLDLLLDSGYADRIRALAGRGAEIIGICGGLQMLGTTVEDPLGVEGTARSAPGLGLLSIRTVLRPGKTTILTRGKDHLLDAAVQGYEIHCGVTVSSGSPVIMTADDGREIGWGCSSCWGTYVHGLWDREEYREAWIRRAAERKGLRFPGPTGARYLPSEALDRLADCLREHLSFPAPWAEVLSDARTASGAAS